jgi:trimethylamine:corrinoid methyltransferase-like protein
MTYMEQRQVPHRLQVVDPQGIAAIHDATVQVLSETGVVYEDEEAVELLSAAGAIASDEGLVKIPEALLRQAIESAPPTMLMHSPRARRPCAWSRATRTAARDQIAST